MRSAPLPEDAAPGSPRTLNVRRWSLAAALVAAVLYLRTLGYGWVLDDYMEVVLNPFIQSWSNLPRIFGTTVWTGSGMETFLYRPLSQVTFLVNHGVSGLEPWSYHLANVLLHAGVSVLVVRVGVRWGLPVAAAGLGGVLFALHPVHVEVVAAVHGRKDLLATLFVLGMVLNHARARTEGGPWALLATALFGGALLSKETGAMGLALVAAADLLSPARREILRSPAARGLYAAYASVAVFYLLVRVRVTGTLGVPDTFVWDNPLVALDFPGRIWSALAVLGMGMGTLVVPATLSPDYSYDAIPVATSPLDSRVLLALAMLGLLAWCAVRFRRSHPWVALAVVWYFATLLPASNLLVAVGTIFGDRLLYLPSVAFCLAVSGITYGLYRAARPRVARIAAVALVGLLGAGWGLQSARYTGAWRSDIALFEWAVEAVPRSTKAHHKLGEEYLRADRPAEALLQLDRALAIAPSNVFAAGTRRQAVERLIQEHAELFRDPLGASLPEDRSVLRALARLMDDRGRTDAAHRLREAAGSR
ncbi:MAG: DUF1736 domain-containing protein [Gemmatimonadales bacterium]|nr:MAG: DUF1736 domain-containing protein [Gemmatimonadales bacterium]